MHFPAKGKIYVPADFSDLVLSDGSLVSFCSKFTYLCSVFTQNLSDDFDVQNWLNKAKLAIGTTNSLIFSNLYISVQLQRSLYKSIVVNLLLRGENWALKRNLTVH